MAGSGTGGSESATRRHGTIARVWFDGENLVLLLFQALCLALPAAGVPPWLRRFRGSLWALVLPLSIIVVVVAIAEVPETADALTWVALIGVPIGAALALGWASHGARWWLAPLAAPLLVLAWVVPDEPIGQLATTTLVAGSAITLGRLLAGAAPLPVLKAGIYAMAAVDAYLVFSGGLQPSNAVLVAAAPGPDLPQLQSAGYGTWSIGYGDFFAAAVVGAIIATQRGPQLWAAIALIPVSLAWDQLFLVYSTLPATIPPALVLVGVELTTRRRSVPEDAAQAPPMGSATSTPETRTGSGTGDGGSSPARTP